MRAQAPVASRALDLPIPPTGSGRRDGDAEARLMPGVVLKTLTKRYGDLAAVEGPVARRSRPASSSPCSALRAAARRRHLQAGRRASSSPRPGEIWVGERCLSSPASVVPPGAPAHGDDLPELRALASHDRRRKRAYGLRFKTGRDPGRPGPSSRRDAARGPARHGFEARYPRRALRRAAAARRGRPRTRGRARDPPARRASRATSDANFAARKCDSRSGAFTRRSGSRRST